MKKKLSKANKGMTLVELIIGMALLGIISIVFITVYTSNMYMAVRSGDMTKNISTASSVIENTLEGTTVKNSTTVLGAIEIEGPGGTITNIPNANYTADSTIVLKVLFKGSATNTRTLTGVKKITINTKKDTVNSSTLETEIEVYKP